MEPNTEMTQIDWLEQSTPAAPSNLAEEWRLCPGFERYEVSSFGRFRNRQTRSLMAQQKEINGYPIVMLTKDGKQRCILAHRIVCHAFHGPPPINRNMVNHIDGSRDNNRAVNLEWVSRSENAKHWIRDARRTNAGTWDLECAACTG